MAGLWYILSKWMCSGGCLTHGAFGDRRQEDLSRVHSEQATGSDSSDTVDSRKTIGF